MLENHVLGSRKTWLAAALLAAGSLIFGALTAGVDPASAAPDATAAKKKRKCATGFVKVKVKRKLKCLPAPGPRATLTWSNGTLTPVDLDLVAWDPAGNRVGGIAFGAIPGSSLSPDNQTQGPEIFTDELKPSIRDFTFGACVSNTNGVTDTVATLVYRPADGSTRTVTSLAGQLAADHGFALLHLGTFNPGPAPFCS